MAPQVLIGNLFDTKTTTLVNTVNCVGVMGKGIAEAFKKRYPDMYAQYRLDCKLGRIKVGEPTLYTDLLGTSIINFPTKTHWKSPSLLKDIEKGLDVFLEKYKEWNIKSVAFPPLGCGNGGLSWDDVGPLMYQKLLRAEIPVEMYAPYGTSPEKIKSEFLLRSRDDQLIRGVRYSNVNNPGNLIALEVLHRLEKQKYAKPVGRVILQKIYFVLTSLKVDTGLTFSKASYGPYSSAIKKVLHTFANQNLLTESQYGEMLRQTVGSEYLFLRKRIAGDIEHWEPQISRTVDLFSRIKDTNQAEEVTTILYSVNDLCKKNPKLSEEELLNYIINWKKSWSDSPKIESVSDSIRNLEAMGWIKLNHDFSTSVNEMEN